MRDPNLPVSNLASIFAKPIDRPIEGVIKADDEASLRSEVEEYILTNELARRLEEFLGAYTHYTNANGVWISGFFGSGKSHLLKMLALLLENREVEGAPRARPLPGQGRGQSQLDPERRPAQGSRDPCQEHPLQHRPEGRCDQQDAGGRPAGGLRQGL